MVTAYTVAYTHIIVYALYCTQFSFSSFTVVCSTFSSNVVLASYAMLHSRFG